MRSVVLLSGGQDSTTCLFQSFQRGDEVTALTIAYGQRHRTEVDAARSVIRLARMMGVDVHHVVLNAAVIAEIGDSDLVRSGAPLRSSGGLADAQAPAGLPTSFVPARNLVFLSLAAAVACRVGARTIVTGVCETDYSGYPDCRREFVDAFQSAATLALPSSAGPIAVETPLMHLSKAETVLMALRLPGCMDALRETVTCYEGMRPGCGHCPACELRARGFREARIPDPAEDDR